MQIQEEREEKEKEKKKVIFGQTTPNHHTLVIQGGRERQDKSNDAVKVSV